MRKQLLNKAVKECLNEMYIRSQPSISYDEIIEGYKNGTYSKDDLIFEKHYLSQEEYMDILLKYCNAYKITSVWKDYVQVVQDYLINGGNKDKYVEAYTDDLGYHPGHRTYEKVPPLSHHIKNILLDYNLDNENMCKDIISKVLEIIDTCKNYYKFNSEECSFHYTISNYSPSSNKDRVQSFYKDLLIYDTEFDPITEQYVKVTPEQINIWKEYLTTAEKYEIKELTTLINKYSK